MNCFGLKPSNPSAVVDLPENQVLVSIADNETPGSVDEDFNPAVSFGQRFHQPLHNLGSEPSDSKPLI